ncbi:histidine phosphatase family protein [Lactobacillus sp. S2-2]|uniref:histidine phosphatase family protein n=1 Tax=Lactobacillus sp. S2-2 TaxID=2692917 RepID=UPI001F37E9FC|nr:histidine phosphatase family protein [Lactobacillus sp. S2-2]MCF6514871.1 histidine phosphatase family protein [Lactobacillus sp. S2-2]
MKFYFVRHGKTEWNLEGRYQGSGGDSPLLEQSYQEIKEVGKYLSNVKFEHIYSSPIKRTMLTSFGIKSKLKHKVSISFDSRLKEFNLGKLEGMKFEDAKQIYPESYINFREHPDLFNPIDIEGESYSNVINRMNNAISQYAMYHDNDSNILIVSHGAALNAIINTILGIPMKDLRAKGGIANTSTTILETNDDGQTFKLVDWNNTSYLNKKLDKTDLI